MVNHSIEASVIRLAVFLVRHDAVKHIRWTNLLSVMAGIDVVLRYADLPFEVKSIARWTRLHNE
jgi:hypothetical protein